jgi:hypothetical protein
LRYNDALKAFSCHCSQFKPSSIGIVLEFPTKSAPTENTDLQQKVSKRPIAKGMLHRLSDWWWSKVPVVSIAAAIPTKIE